MWQALKNIYHYLISIFSLVYFRFPGSSLTVIGITGTDGKTTTATLLYHMLKDQGIRASLVTSVESIVGGVVSDTDAHVTTPNAFMIQKCLRKAASFGDTHVVLEVSSHGIDQGRVFGIPFRVAAITNVSAEHLDYHKTLDTYLATKCRLLMQAEKAVVNRDEPFVYKTLKGLFDEKKMITYGRTSQATVNPKIVPFKSILPGEYNIYNCLASLACAKALNLDMARAAKTIATFPGVRGRMEVVYKGPYRVIVDFAHTPNALEKCLGTVSGEGKLIHVFGCAGKRDPFKRPAMGAISDKYADTIILTEEDSRTENVMDIMEDISRGIRNKTKVKKISDRAKAIRCAISLAKRGDTVLITGKGHETSLCRGKTEYPWSDKKEVLHTIFPK
jgi:UDP-N-acetylmuramoyl-L-alanyl-D-glutamate--2,6-diaminopimelate ligase